MQITVNHKMRLDIGHEVHHGVQHFLLTPRSGPTQIVESWTLDAPGFETAPSFTDAFGNIAHCVSQTDPIDAIEISIQGVVNTLPGNGVLGFLAEDMQTALYRRITPLTRSPVNVYGKYRNAEANGMPQLEVLHGLMERVNEQLSTTDEMAEEAPLLSCADYAHSFVGAARALGIPARYVNGYIADTGDGLGGEHAWSEAFVDGLGWVAFDAMLNVCPTDRHIRLCTGLDAATALPVRTVPVVEYDAIEDLVLEITIGEDKSTPMGQSQEQSFDGQSQTQG